MAKHSAPITVRRHKKERAIIFIHGFSGNAHLTFGMFPAFLAGNPALFDWDIYCFGYATSLAPDVTGVWTSDPDLTVLSGMLKTAITQGAFADYSQLALIAHSMGGLVVQRALVDGTFENRVLSVVLFGTPSNGLKKAFIGRFLKPQARDMVFGGKFVATLREDWDKRFGDSTPFSFWPVAGTLDQFVPQHSSVEIFHEDVRQYVDGNHLEIVKPESMESDSVLLVLRALTPGGGQSLKPPVSTRLRGLATKALDVELREGGQKALDFLMAQPQKDSDTGVMGAIAGRLKRLWLADQQGHRAAGPAALDWYKRAYDLAKTEGDHEQAYYHGINVAFLQLALLNKPGNAQETASQVLLHCTKAPENIWRWATEGEAHLYRGEIETAIHAYQEALQRGPTHRDIDSMYRQAIWAARLMKSPSAESQLNEVFGTRG